MLRTEHSSLARPRYGAGKIFYLLALLLAPVTPELLGQESTSTQTLLRCEPWPAEAYQMISYFSAIHTPSPFSVPLLRYEATVLKPDSPETSVASFGNSLLGPGWYYRLDGFQFIDKKTVSDGRTDFWGHIEAGYGKFCRLDSDFGNSAMELEQPSCAYLKAQFSF